MEEHFKHPSVVIFTVVVALLAVYGLIKLLEESPNLLGWLSV